MMSHYSLDKTKMHQLHLAISNMYTLVISANYTQDMFSVLESKLDKFPITDNNKNFKNFISKYLSTCHSDDLYNYPLIYDFDSLIDHLKNNKGVYTYEARFEIMPSVYSWFEGTYFLVDTPESEDVLLLLLFKDINDKKQIEESLKDAFKATEIAAKAKTDFLSRMSRDIRTPINLIVSMIDTARQNIEDKENVMDCLIKMDISSRYLFHLIDNVLEMSQIEAGKFNVDNSPFDITELFEEVRKKYEKQAAAKNISFDVLIHNNGFNNVIGDAFRVKQILKNLICNSFKFVSPEGMITIELLLNKILYNRAFFSLIVENDGSALNDNEIEKLFLPFEKNNFSTNQGFSDGLGLGLSICKNIVELLGGTITASNKPNQGGVRFEVEIAFELDENNVPNDIEQLADAAYIRFPHTRILIAEDNQEDYEKLKALLENRGILVDLAINGIEVVEAFEQSEPEYYDLILMNTDLPLMSGLDATKAIRNSFHSNGSSIPIIAMTIDVLKQNIMAALESGMNDHILKPIDVNRLFSTLKNYI